MKQEIKQHPVLGRVLYLSDGRTELAVTLDCGIRIVRLCLVGKENLFYEQPSDLSDGLTTPEGWRIYGGHRLWMAPESDLTYSPDNAPVTCTSVPNGICMVQAVDAWTGLQKSVEVRYEPDGAIRVIHAMKNCGDAPIRAAAWGVSSMAPGGQAIVPLPRHDGKCISNPHRSFCLWNTTTLGDPRLTFELERLILRQDANVSDYFKLGLYSDEGRVEYRNFGQSFTITFSPHAQEEYTDMGSNLELFANTRVQEIETLGVYKELSPGETTTHTEFWRVDTV